MAETAPTAFTEYMKGSVPRRRTLDILEIGGGAKTHVPMANARYTVVDVCEDALERNRYASDVIVGDAQSMDYGARKFDILVFWNTLEHMADPGAALLQALPALRPNGLVVVRGPELRSLKGLVTRLTPHWFHVQFYRRVLGRPDAGQPGSAPYAVEHAGDASPERIVDLLGDHRCRIEFEEHYVGDQLKLLRAYSKTAYAAYQVASGVLRGLTRARWGLSATDFVFAFRKLA
ncbi:bifunctional 2-polyprenyl-6-hydroxyphenol methylase/3-demethylubiquinol 3-O-methyltransferase UbiG [Aureimonas sp. AU12]|uniref:class I SAM-dependent methyltransferase n=1 Tax=Aureimonas sp. AU12 TaxID=1638161 RepID=UPI000780AD44|nr:methyltransferase domain-containing protein [Aureimonas sp. AU12]